MRKLARIWLCVLLALSLAACTASQPAQEPQEDPESHGLDPADQVKLIAENRELWLVTDASQADAMMYAVSDIDENGRLELIASVTEGTGMFSTSYFYEVSEDFAALEPVTKMYGTNYSEPDISWNDSFRCYKGELGNFIVSMDQTMNGYAERYYSQDFLLLREGTVDAATIAYCMVLAEDSNGDGEPELHAYYYAAGGSGGDDEEISSEQYATAADDFFGYAYDRYVMDLGWTQFDEAARKSEVDVPAALAESWKAFGFRKDMAAFNKLYESPSAYYDKLYENGEKAAIVYGMESLADYWQLQEIGTEFEARIAAEENIDCHLIIGQDGMASFSYNDPTDARSPIEIENMPIAMTEDGMGSTEEEPVEAVDPEVTDSPEDAPPWLVAFMTDDGLNRFEAYIGPEDGRLYVTWYWWSEEDPGADPAVTYMVFTNGVG